MIFLTRCIFRGLRVNSLVKTNTNILSHVIIHDITHSHTHLSTDLRKNLWSDVRLGVEEVQHVARMLNAVFGCLFRGGEPVVPGPMEVFKTARAIFQLIALTRYNGLLLGHTAGRDTFLMLTPNIANIWDLCTQLQEPERSG